MHQHTIEMENFDREAKKLNKEMDEEIKRVKAEAIIDLKDALSRKEQLQKELENSDTSTDIHHKKKLMQELGHIEAQIAKRMTEEAGS